jgi:hypothetical protein
VSQIDLQLFLMGEIVRCMPKAQPRKESAKSHARNAVAEMVGVTEEERKAARKRLQSDLVEQNAPRIFSRLQHSHRIFHTKCAKNSSSSKPPTPQTQTRKFPVNFVELISFLSMTEEYSLASLNCAWITRKPHRRSLRRPGCVLDSLWNRQAPGWA